MPGARGQVYWGGGGAGGGMQGTESVQALRGAWAGKGQALRVYGPGRSKALRGARKRARPRGGHGPERDKRPKDTQAWGGTLGRGCLSPRPHQADWRAVIRA